MQTCRRLLPLMVVALTACSMSCGKGKKLELVPASGKLLDADGKPFKGVNIMFWPNENPEGFVSKHNSTPYAINGENGQFEMRMDANTVGVPPGSYQVTVFGILPEDKIKIPKRYNELESSPLEVTIPLGGKTDIVLQIDGK
jgi:hypothetical protein